MIDNLGSHLQARSLCVYVLTLSSLWSNINTTSMQPRLGESCVAQAGLKLAMRSVHDD